MNAPTNSVNTFITDGMHNINKILVVGAKREVHRWEALYRNFIKIYFFQAYGDYSNTCTKNIYDSPQAYLKLAEASRLDILSLE